MTNKTHFLIVPMTNDTHFLILAMTNDTHCLILAMTNDTHFVILAASGCIDAKGCKKTYAAAYLCDNTIVPGLGGQLCPVTCQCCRKHLF